MKAICENLRNFWIESWSSQRDAFWREFAINSENNSNRGVTWARVLAATICFAPVLYVISSGPMKMAFEKLGQTSETHERVFAPLVWLNENTPVSGALTWYWGLFPTNAKQELDVDPTGKWLYSPEARAIKRNLGVAD